MSVALFGHLRMAAGPWEVRCPGVSGAARVPSGRDEGTKTGDVGGAGLSNQVRVLQRAMRRGGGERGMLQAEPESSIRMLRSRKRRKYSPD